MRTELGMGFGWIGMLLILVLVVLAIAARYKGVFGRQAKFL